MRYIILFTLVLSFHLASFTQTTQLSIKSINSFEFSSGDRILLGATPDSLNQYNTFILANPFITFNLICSVKSAKTAASQEGTTNSILTALNANVSKPVEAVTLVDSKQKEPIYYYLKVVSVSAQNLYESRAVVFSNLPENNLLYREYDNLIELNIVGPPRKLFLQTTDSAVTFLETDSPNMFTVRIGAISKRELTLYACTVYNSDTIRLARLRYRVGNLPVPNIYLGTFPLDKAKIKVDKGTFKSMGRLFAKLAPEIPLKAAFEIKKVAIRLGETSYTFEGPAFPDEIKQAIREVPDGTLLFFEEIEVTYNERHYATLGNYCFELCDKYK